MSDLKQYLINRRDALLAINEFNMANEFEIILEDFAGQLTSDDYISKKSLLEWLQNEADERKGIPLLHGNIHSYLRTKEFVESGRFDIPSPAEGRYREAMQKAIKVLDMPVSSVKIEAQKILYQALSPIGEQKEDTSND